MTPEVHRLELPLTIARREVLHFLGYPEGREPRGRIAERLADCLAEARRKAEGRALWRSLPAEAAAEVGLTPIPAQGLAIGLVTAGAAIVDAATTCLATEDATGALLLDACGSAAAEEAADRASAAIVATLAARSGAKAPAALLAPSPQGRAAAVSCRISPGYGSWKLSSQVDLFARLPHREIGLRLEESMLMTPRKSISFAMWLGADARPVAGLSGCARCELETCRYRRSPRSVEESAQ